MRGARAPDAARQGHLAMLAFSAIVAGSFSLGGMAAPFMDPAALTAVRFALAALVLWGAVLVAGGFGTALLSGVWRYGVLAGLFAIYFTTMFEGLKTAEPVSLAAVFTLNPGLTAVFGYLVVAQVTTPRMAAAILLGGIGALWVIFDGSAAAALAFEMGRGEAIYFGGCVAHALFAPMLRRLNRGEPALAFTACILTAGTLLLTLWSWEALLATPWASLPPVVWITILYTALPATALTFVILRFATLRLPSAKVMAYTYLTPSWVILWEIALGQGAPTAAIAPGIAATVLALLLLLRNEPQHGPAGAG